MNEPMDEMNLMMFLMGKSTVQSAQPMHPQKQLGEQKWQFLLQAQLPNEALQPAILSKLHLAIRDGAAVLAVNRPSLHPTNSPATMALNTSNMF